MKNLSLNGRWQFRGIDGHGVLPVDQKGILHWMNGSVPGTVHTDLLALKKIPDPFYRMNENDVQWIDSVQWHYRKTFSLSESFLSEKHIHLVAEGIDTFAEILLNGNRIAQTDNMFLRHRFNARPLLHPGQNTLEIILDSPILRAQERERRFGPLYSADTVYRAYVRKAQYSYGWDWGPRLTTSGIWKPIYLEAYSCGRIENLWIKTIDLNSEKARLEIIVDTLHTMGQQHLYLFIGGNGFSMEKTLPIHCRRSVATITIPHPRRWWPNGYGNQPLYTLVATLTDGGEEIDSREIQFGLRTVRLLQKPDHEGESFALEINGKKIFCKGACWIPSDSFIPRIADSTYETLLTMAHDAHCTMIRVWGGGIYEQEKFYTLCDELGLMVWQDFMFACSDYPDQLWFQESVREEAEQTLRRLRNHPSIVLWCGNNECEWLYAMKHPFRNVDSMKGMPVFRDILRESCEQNDGTRPYWRSTPFGKGFPNKESDGNHHQWRVWSAWKDYPLYEKNNARFVSEFGFQAPADRRTLEEVSDPEDRTPQSSFMQHHNKQINGPTRLRYFQEIHHHPGETFDDFIYKAQLVQAEAIKCGVEHWRRRKFDTAGALFWQWNDCWPVSSWSAIDSALRPKALYYYTRKFFSPVLVSIKKRRSAWEIWGANDTPDNLTGDFCAELKTFNGTVLWKSKKLVTLAADSSEIILPVLRRDLPVFEEQQTYLHCSFRKKDHLITDNRFFFVEPKELLLGKPEIKPTVTTQKEGIHLIRLFTPVFAKSLRIEIGGERSWFSDNYFDLDANIEKEVIIFSALSTGQLLKRLRLHYLQ